LQSPGGGNHVERKLCGAARMTGARRWDSCNRHVVVADRFNLFDAEVFGKPVEFAEQLIQATDDLISLHARRDFSEADDIRKNNGRVFEMICNIAFSTSQARGDIGRKYVSQ